MQTQWNQTEAEQCGNDPLSLRTYASTLLSQRAPSLTAFSTVKIEAQSLFGEAHTQLFANQAGSNRRLSPDESLPLGSLIHAALPFRFVDQVRSAPLLALAHHSEASKRTQEVFGDRIQYAPLQTNEQNQADALRSFDLNKTEGILLPGTGLIVFSNEAQSNYDRCIEFATRAEAYFEKFIDNQSAPENGTDLDPHDFADLRRHVSTHYGQAVIAIRDASQEALDAASNLEAKPTIAKTEGDHDTALQGQENLQQILWPHKGVFTFSNCKDSAIRLSQDAQQVWEARRLAQATGDCSPNFVGTASKATPITPKNGTLQGKVALVSGSAAGIGLATATALIDAGATVVGADINPEIQTIMAEIGALGIPVDLTQDSQIEALINRIVSEYGGLDIVVSNAGIFTAGAYIQEMESNNWDRSLAVNLTSHQVLLKHAIPFLKKGIDPTIIIMGSRNVNAPGAGAASYSCAKAALTQLCRVAALELAPDGVRVNIIHPDAVFDTKLWTQEALERSAERYGITVEQYKKRNLMKTEITSRSVGNTVVAVASTAFAKTTGAQIPVDGGNDRII